MAQKLSTQLTSSASGSSNFLNRTQRVQENTQRERNVQRNNALLAQAKEIQETQFKDKTVTEKYYEYIPSQYLGRDGEPTWAWNRMQSSAQSRAIDNARKAGTLVSIERTRNTVIPFTLDEGTNSYSNIYQNFSPELKALFASPETLKAEKTTRISQTLTDVQQKKELADQKINEATTDYKRRLEWAQQKDWSRAEDRRKYKDELSKEYKADVRYWQAYKRGLSQAEGQLSGNKELSFNEIINYAEDSALAEKNSSIATSERSLGERQQQSQQNKLQEAIKGAKSFIRVREEVAGKPTQEKVYALSPTGNYTLIGQNKPTQDTSSAKPSKFKIAQITQDYSLGNLKLSFKSLENLYTSKKGNLLTAYGDLGVSEQSIIDEQNAQQQKEQTLRDQRAMDYLTEKGFESKVSTPPKKETIFTKGFNTVKALYATTPFGTSIKMPDEYLEKRTRFDPLFFLSAKPAPIYSTTYPVALAGVKAERDKNLRGQSQQDAIAELGKLTSEAPEDIQYEVQQKGLGKLTEAGITSELNPETGLIEFKSKDFNASKSFNIFELEKAATFNEKYKDKWFVKTFISPERKVSVSLPYQTRGTSYYDGSKYYAPTTEVTIPEKKITISPASVGVGSRIIGTKALEFYIVGKGFETALASAANLASGTYRSLGGGLKFTSASLRGGQVSANVAPSLFGGKIAKVVTKVGGYAATAGLYTVGGGLYLYGKTRQKKQYEEAYGDVGKQAFKYETVGELVGIGALIGEGISRRESTKAINKRIDQENYKRLMRSEQLKNIKLYGQDSRYAKTIYKGVGSGRKLSDGEVTQLSKIYSEATRVTRKEAVKQIQEGALFRETLTVKSPTGLPKYESNRFSLYTSAKSQKGSQELALEFTKRGTRLQNVAIKTTTGQGKYALTTIFEKARFSPKNPTQNLKLQKQIISKIVKAESVKGGSSTVKIFEVENRVAAYKPYGNERLGTDEIFKIGLPRMKESQLSKMFVKAGKSSRLSEFPSSNIRTESPLFRDFNIDKNLRIKYFSGDKVGSYNVNENVKGFAVRKTYGGFEKGEIYIRETIPLKEQILTLKHELGHVYTYDKGIYGGVTREQAKKYLAIKYSGRVPKAYDGNEVAEFLADKYAGQVAQYKISYATGNEFRFAQGGVSDRTVSIKNIFKNTDFKDIEKILSANKYRTPLSRTFGKTKPTLTSFGTGKGGSTALKVSQISQSVSVKDVAMSPTVRSDVKMLLSEKLLAKIAATSFQSQGAVLGLASLNAAAPRSAQLQQLKSQLRERVVSVPASRINQRQDQQMQQAQKSVAIESFAFPTFPEINSPFIEITPRNTTTTKTATGGLPPWIFKDTQRLERKMLKNKKQKGVDVDFLLPDFASRALGISPQRVSSEKAALREIKRIQTGLELRRGIVLN